jgi:transcriptional regulator with XRE-family HTH domain
MRPRTKTVKPGRLCVAVTELRKVLKLTQQQLAQALKTSITTIARYESGRTPNGKILVRLRELSLEQLKRDPDNGELEILDRVFYGALVDESPLYRLQLANAISRAAGLLREPVMGILDDDPTILADTRKRLGKVLEHADEIEQLAGLLDPVREEPTLRECRRPFNAARFEQLLQKAEASLTSQENQA